MNTMNILTIKRHSLALILLMFFGVSACQSTPKVSIDEYSNDQPLKTITAARIDEKEAPLATIIPEPKEVKTVSISGTIPEEMQNLILKNNIVTASSEFESIILEQVGKKSVRKNVIQEIEWVYVLAAPFSTVSDNLPYHKLIQLWVAEAGEGELFQTLIIDSSTYEIFTQEWGQAGDNVRVVSTELLLETVLESQNAISIIAFEELAPKWKVINLTGVSPLDSNFEREDYPLAIQFAFSFDQNQKKWVIGSEIEALLQSLPESNFEKDKVTSVLLTGVTALVRETAVRIERYGIDYPASEIKFLFDQVDFLHISNEVSLYSACPPAIPPRAGGRFCSSPEYVDLFTNIGVDVIELTGNHLLDYGPEAFLETLEIYEESGIMFYGGGEDQEAANETLLLELNGNKLAFLGCNVPGPESVFATEKSPGAAECNIDELVQKVNNLKEQGYNAIVTVQHYESCQLLPMSGQRVDFNRIAEGGAVIVSGSQAHCPQGMQFVGETFVHYGLGNLFFDQMYPDYRNEFLDEHIFYDGNYLGVVLHTAVLEDYSRPRMMTVDEREEFLETVFGAGSW